MPFNKITAWKVTIVGEVYVPAETGDAALALAKEFFTPLDKGITWDLKQQDAYTPSA